jgi:hypothetical protein
MYWKQAVEQQLQIENLRKAMETGARDILPDVARRVFTDGKATDGSDIGAYSTKPIYISKKNSPRSAGIVKKKTLFFPGGYKQFKSDIGRGDEVNLKVFGRLQTDYLTPLKKDTPEGLSFELKEAANAEKKEGNEKRFGKDIFNLNQTEKDKVTNTISFEVARRIKQ